MTQDRINLKTPLSLTKAFQFPLQHARARREVFIGGALLLIPVVGWLMNMGHRIEMVHRMQHGESAWPVWSLESAPKLLKHGALTCLGMVEYHAPAAVCFGLAWYLDQWWLYLIGALLWVVATVAVPGYMSHYCVAYDAREIFDPRRAFARVHQGGGAYWRAWGIALSALVMSFSGLLLGGIGFLWTSVWFWQVAGFGFATVFTKTFELGSKQAIASPVESR